jgi:NAD(P)-dependent dehydrogenase (short-subunit alcohol dehydrogenase family)
MTNLNNKTVLVTGGSRGIGAAIARAIGAAGGEVIVHYAHNWDAADAARRAAMRISLSSWATTEDDVDRSLSAILGAHRSDGPTSGAPHRPGYALEVGLEES